MSGISIQSDEISEGTPTMSEVSVSSYQGKRRSSRKSMAETIEFRFIVAVSFAVCLIGFAFRRISGRAPKGASYMSCVTEARAAAHAAAGYAFHG
jgi:hypothetical protein